MTINCSVLMGDGKVAVGATRLSKCGSPCITFEEATVGGSIGRDITRNEVNKDMRIIIKIPSIESLNVVKEALVKIEQKLIEDKKGLE